MTKLLTTISALQLVDRGLISLSDDISPHLPALASQPILSPSGELVPRTRPITLRHLLTHSSGCGYPFLSPRLATHLGPPPPGPRPTSSVPARFNYPLLFEPGTGWAYGSGLDWAGQLVEVLTGEPLLSHMQKHILSPLGIDPSRLGFFPVLPTTTNSSSSPAAAAASVAVPHLAKLADRDSQGKVTHGTSPDFLGLPCGSFPDPVPAFGGESGYADMGVYISVLYSLLVDDEKLLSREVAAQMFRPALQEAEAKASLLKELEHPEWVVGVVPKTGKYDWGLGGLLVDGDGDGEGEGYGRRRRGFLFWGGVFNMAWVSLFPFFSFSLPRFSSYSFFFLFFFSSDGTTCMVFFPCFFFLFPSSACFTLVSPTSPLPHLPLFFASNPSSRYKVHANTPSSSTVRPVCAVSLAPRSRSRPIPRCGPS